MLRISRQSPHQKPKLLDVLFSKSGDLGQVRLRLGEFFLEILNSGATVRFSFVTFKSFARTFPEHSLTQSLTQPRSCRRRGVPSPWS